MHHLVSVPSLTEILRSDSCVQSLSHQFPHTSTLQAIFCLQTPSQWAVTVFLPNKSPILQSCSSPGMCSELVVGWPIQDQLHLKSEASSALIFLFVKQEQIMILFQRVVMRITRNICKALRVILAHTRHCALPSVTIIIIIILPLFLQWNTA